MEGEESVVSEFVVQGDGGWGRGGGGGAAGVGAIDGDERFCGREKDACEECVVCKVSVLVETLMKRRVGRGMMVDLPAVWKILMPRFSTALSKVKRASSSRLARPGSWRAASISPLTSPRLSNRAKDSIATASPLHS